MLGVDDPLLEPELPVLLLLPSPPFSREGMNEGGSISPAVVEEDRFANRESIIGIDATAAGVSRTTNGESSNPDLPPTSSRLDATLICSADELPLLPGVSSTDGGSSSSSRMRYRLGVL